MDNNSCLARCPKYCYRLPYAMPRPGYALHLRNPSDKLAIGARELMRPICSCFDRAVVHSYLKGTPIFEFSDRLVSGQTV
jgi:hypothetical protein